MKRHRRHGRHHNHYYSNSTECSFCHKSVEGLPHKCKYCGEIHCNDHIVPESHNCIGLNNIKRDFGISNRNNSTSSWGDTQSQHYPKQFRERKQRFHKPHFSFRLPRFRMSKFIKALLIAVAGFLLAYYYKNTLTLWIEAFAWIYFTFILYRKAFRWANRVSMADDLKLWGLRSLGVIVFIVGVYACFAVGVASIFTKNPAPMSIPMFTLLGGLVLLGMFIAFRTNRRHQVVGIWRA